MAVKKVKLNAYQKGLLIGGGAVLAMVGVVKGVAMQATPTPVAVNEVKESGAREMTVTGLVTREAATPSGKDRYVITTADGTKYILIGLKQSYDNPGKSGENQGKNPSPKPSKTPNPNDSEDKVAFESYVGKRVSLIGFVVPVALTMDKGKPSMSPKAKENNGKKPSSTPKPSATPIDSGFEYARFVVKTVTLLP